MKRAGKITDTKVDDIPSRMISARLKAPPELKSRTILALNFGLNRNSQNPTR